jgi:lipoprotein-anchoring transpeptidase ErfK/SrfK
VPKVGVPVRVALVGCLLVVLAGCVGPLARDVIPVVVVGTSQAATIESAGVGSPTLTLDAAAAPDGWRPDQPIVVNAVAGSLSEVKVTAKGGGEVPGTLSEDGRHWQSSGVLLPGTTYRVTTAMTGSSPQLSATKSVKIRTMDSTPSFEARISPRDGARVGVGMPVLVRFSAPVAEEYRANVQRALTVTSTPAVEGGWSWASDTRVEYRPREFWPARTTVAVSAALAGVQAGADMWGAQDKGVEFTIGRSVVSVVDVASHEMAVSIDGTLARSIPVTTGKDGFATRGGTRVISEVLAQTRMDAASTGVEPGDPEYYNLNVRYAMRMTNSGEFIHAAPWSLASQGVDNVSHGCVGMSLTDARWLFERSRVGDVVTIVNSTRELEPGNGLTQWNVTWEDWTAGSAL